MPAPRSSGRGWLPGWARRDRRELVVLLGGLAAVLLVAAFFVLAAMVLDGDTQSFDAHVLRALRRADDPSTPIGPAWLRSGALDITALGSPTVLGLVTLAVCGFLLLQRMGRTAAFVFVATSGGWLVNSLLKDLFNRPRPDVVPHLRDVMSLSFPSGHAMTSAAVYLTLGALSMRVADRRSARIYCITVAMGVSVLVGASRVYLGVHYPTDVLAGWLAGMLWALACWSVEQRVERAAGLRDESRAAAAAEPSAPTD
ncbi:MAG: phosphatase PAP2 family protein [Vicinamibacterales bacterium]